MGDMPTWVQRTAYSSDRLTVFSPMHEVSPRQPLLSGWQRNSPASVMAETHRKRLSMNLTDFAGVEEPQNITLASKQVAVK